jgi:acyl-CoA reductase-like NAD-dependent aldehyde dehydrogenase
MNPLTVKEMRLRQAQLDERAERLRQEWRRLPSTARAVELGKQVKALQERADDYAALLRVAEGMS